MSTWTWPAYVGVVGGVLLFGLLLVPILLFQVRRYGALNGRRLVGAAAVAVYGVALVAYTLLPLPTGDLAAWCAAHGYGSAQLRPLQFVDDIRDATAGEPLSAAIRSPAVLQVVLNVVLFVPWGVIVRRFLGWRLLPAVASAFAASLLIETTQYTGIFGLIPCSYRVGDVDDLLTNTLGGLLGALVAPVVLRWMPQAHDLAAHRGEPRPVTVWRRWLGMLLDAAAFVGLGFVLDVAYRLVLVAAGRPTPTGEDGVDWVLGNAVPLVVVFVWPALVGSGASWGQRAVWLDPGLGGRPRRLLRATVPGGLWGLCGALASVPASWGLSDVAEVARVAAAVLAVVAVVAVPFTRGRRGLSGVVSGAVVRDVRGETRWSAAQSDRPSPSSTP
ncbi:VanZ family protein [Luteimicrobium sp. NPDC057192]|uniref:VanZ family protein n=1 Tax=Luteimicrobium sp. NPDC057192 TaxID=3346042 RepID=UPI00362E2971